MVSVAMDHKTLTSLGKVMGRVGVRGGGRGVGGKEGGTRIMFGDQATPVLDHTVTVTCWI